MPPLWKKFLTSPRPAAFIARLLLFTALFTAVTLSPPFKALVERPAVTVYTHLSAQVLGLLGEDARVSGAYVTSPRFSIEVVSGCTGIFVYALFAAAVLAFPASLRRRGVALLLGAVLIFILNEVRIVTLFLAGLYEPGLFEDLHLYVWQGAVVVAVASYWYFWAARSAPSASGA